MLIWNVREKSILVDDRIHQRSSPLCLPRDLIVMLNLTIEYMDKNSSNHDKFLRCILEQSRVIGGQAGRARCIVICISPTPTQIIDGTEKPKIPLKFGKRAARYN